MTESDHSLQSQLVRLRSRVDEHFEAALNRSPDAMQCRSGCDHCCQRRFGVFAIEAAAISAALQTLDPASRARIRKQAEQDVERCPLLLEGRCSVYEARPLICRSHGLPIVFEDDEGHRHVDHCPLNFGEGHPPHASLLVLDAINRPLAVMARLWDGTAERIQIVDIARRL